MQETIPKIEYDSAYNMLETILTQRVEDIELSDTIPPLDDITDSNKVFKGKLSILFVDMRKSTDLTDELKSKKMVKIYRSFIRMIVQAIRYCDGQSRQFAGDGVLGVFQDDLNDSDDILETKINPVTSCEKAVRAARYILTLIDYCLNPQLKKHLGDISIGCGVGICTGTVMVTKIGMRGKEADNTAENEMGIVWVGQTTNYASRLCSLAAPREIFIDEETYKNISPIAELWKKETRVKGTKPFTGYIASENYLSLSDDIKIQPIISNDTIETDKSFVQSIFDETENRALHLVDEISKKSAELTLALENIKRREEQVRAREIQANQNDNRLSILEQDLKDLQNEVDDKEKENKTDEYNLYKSLFSETFCKEPIIKQLGKDYWTKLFNKMYILGQRIGKSKQDVDVDLAIYSLDIYIYFDMFDDAYNSLCLQAEYGSWIISSRVENVVKNAKLFSRLKNALEKRINPSNAFSKERNYFLEALEILKKLGY